jgi:hypothetical protein
VEGLRWCEGIMEWGCVWAEPVRPEELERVGGKRESLTRWGKEEG